VPNEARVDEIIADAEKAGGTIFKPAATLPWGGFGGSLADLDGYIWNIGYSAWERPALSGVASKQFDVDRGLAVATSFCRTYAELATAPSLVELALFVRHALAKAAGVDDEVSKLRPASGAHELGGSPKGCGGAR
jgi:hypothetical protein